MTIPMIDISNVTQILAKFVTPDTTKTTAYTLSFDNAFFHPHDGHNSDGGIIASTGFFIDGASTGFF